MDNTLLHDIPRGIATRRFSEQTAPQARFLNPAEVLDHPSIAYDPGNPGGKLLLGTIDNQLIGIEDNRHMLTVAGSRAGKSVTLINNLFFYPGSVLCTDPKGELAEITALHRLRLGQKVYILDPFQIVQGDAATYRANFNPMALLTLANRYIVEDTMQITDALVMTTGKEKDPHWDESARHLLMTLILYVSTHYDLPEQQKNLITVRRLLNNALALTDDRSDFNLNVHVVQSAQKLHSGGFDDLAVLLAGAIRSFYDKGHEERNGVLSNARRHTQFLDFYSMKGVLSGHDFNLADLKSDPAGMSVYLVLPATRMSMCNRWLRLFVNQLLDVMERERQRPTVPVLVCLDEFPVLGFMKQLQDAAGQIASFGVKLWVIMQDWGQGKALYGERFESFAANAGILQAFGNVDVTTTEYLSRRLGQTVVEDQRIDEVTAEQKKKGLSGKRGNRQQYPLMTPNEIALHFARSDPLQRQLILWAGVDPMILQRLSYFDPQSPIRAYLSPCKG